MKCKLESRVCDKAVHQSYYVKATGHMPEFATQMKKVFASLGLRDNVKVAAKRYLQLATVEKFKMTGLFAYRATYSFGNSSHFAPVWCEKRENAISFTYISALEYYGLNGVAALLSHGDTLKMNRRIEMIKKDVTCESNHV